MKVIVTKDAIRQYIREMFESPGIGWQSTGSTSTFPVGISPIVDPSAAVTDPGNPNFKPQNRKELQTAISTMIDDISDDEASEFYDSLKHSVNDQKEEDEKKMKRQNTAESIIRNSIRKILAEADLPPVKKIPFGVHGGEYLKRQKKKEDDVRKTLLRMKDDEETAGGAGDSGAPAPGRARKNVMQTDVGGASFDEIAKELGYAGPPGARQAVEKALEKVKFLGAMDPDDLQILTLNAMTDYVDELQSSGELTPADVQLLKDHPNIVGELDGFREYLNSYIKKSMK